MSSDEFTKWIAWYRIMDGQVEARLPTPEARFSQLQSWATVHNAKLAAKERG